MHIHGGDIYQNPALIDFSANINPLGIPDAVKNAAKLGVECSAQYPDVRKRALIKAISKYDQIPSSHIVCGNGAAELIFSLVFAYRPKKALVLAPTFAEYEAVLQCSDCEIIYYNLNEKEGFQANSAILDYLSEDLDMIFICNPNNPTGVVIMRELLQQILEKCRINHTMMVVDECFLDFIETPELVTMKPLIRDYENLLIIKAFTKLYAMAGLRLGYVLSGNHSLLLKMKQVTQPWNVSIPAQMAGVAALGEGDYVNLSKQIINREKMYLIAEMEKMGCKIYGSSANYIFFYHPGITMADVRREGFLIRDCSNYHNLEQGYFRIAVRLHQENEALMTAFKQVLSARKEKRTINNG